MEVVWGYLLQRERCHDHAHEALSPCALRGADYPYGPDHARCGALQRARLMSPERATNLLAGLEHTAPCVHPPTTDHHKTTVTLAMRIFDQPGVPVGAAALELFHEAAQILVPASPLTSRLRGAA